MTGKDLPEFEALDLLPDPFLIPQNFAVRSGHLWRPKVANIN